jgi:hypothetical protein
MAKFKKIRRYAAKAYRKGKRYASSNKGISPMEITIGSAGYGAVRPMIANAVPNVGALGEYSDNVILGLVGFAAAWKGKGLVKKAGMVVLGAESFVAGSRLSQNIGGNSTSSGIYIN